MEPAQGQEAQSRSAAEDTILLDHRIAISPLGIEGHVARNCVILKIPFFGQVDVFVPAYQMLTRTDGVFGAGQGFTVDGNDIVNFRATVGFKLDHTFGRQDHRQGIGIALVAATAIFQGNEEILIGDGGNTGGPGDLQLEGSHPGLGLPLLAAGEGQEVHVELPVVVHKGDICALDAFTQQGAVRYQLKKFAVVAEFVLHGVHGVWFLGIGAVQVQCHGDDIASVDLHSVFAVHRSLIPKFRLRRSGRKAQNRQ